MVGQKGGGWRRTKVCEAAPIERDPTRTAAYVNQPFALRYPRATSSSRVASYFYSPARSRRANNILFARPDVTLISLLPRCIGWSAAEQMESHKRQFLP